MAACPKCKIDPCPTPAVCSPTLGQRVDKMWGNVKKGWTNYPKTRNTLLILAGLAGAYGVGRMDFNESQASKSGVYFEVRKVTIGNYKGLGIFLPGEEFPTQLVNFDKKGRLSELMNYTADRDPVHGWTVNIEDAVKIGYTSQNEIDSDGVR